jgi:hypothetical protein
MELERARLSMMTSLTRLNFLWENENASMENEGEKSVYSCCARTYTRYRLGLCDLMMAFFLPLNCSFTGFNGTRYN